MGKKRVQNMIDDKIGTHLAKFETELLQKISKRLDQRLETLEENEQGFKDDIEEMRSLANTVKSTVQRFRKKATLRAVGYSVLGSIVTSIIMLLFMQFAF